MADTQQHLTSTTREALAELVALKDIKDRLAAGLNEVSYFQGGKYLLEEYERRKPLAWAAARAALATQPAQPEPSAMPVEVWRGERKVTVYPGENVIRIWGANIDTDMSDEPFSLDAVQRAMDWLYASAPAQPLHTRDKR